MAHFLEDDFTGDAEPLPIDGEQASLDRIAEAAPFDSHLPDPDEFYRSVMDTMDRVDAAKASLKSDLLDLLATARREAGIA
jgi:hypothetical protein